MFHLARHPAQVARLIAHEPGASQRLPDDERLRSMQVHEEVQQIYRREVVAAAMKKMMAMSGVRFDDREPDVELPQPGDPRVANMAASMNFFLSTTPSKLDMALLQAAATRVVVATVAIQEKQCPVVAPWLLPTGWECALWSSLEAIRVMVCAHENSLRACARFSPHRVD
jgi:hypothetical protein